METAWEMIVAEREVIAAQLVNRGLSLRDAESATNYFIEYFYVQEHRQNK